MSEQNIKVTITWNAAQACSGIAAGLAAVGEFVFSFNRKKLFNLFADAKTGPDSFDRANATLDQIASFE